MKFFTKIKNWTQNIHEYLKKHSRWVEAFFIGLMFLVIVAQFSTVASLLFKQTDSRAVIAALDNDSGVGIGNALDTKFINDNGVRTYGPVYYRLSVIMRYFAVSGYGEVEYSPQEAKEKSVLYHMFLINLLGLYLGSYFIFFMLTHRISLQLVGTVAMVGAFLQNEQRNNLLFMAKPDHLFAAFVTLAFLGSIWYLYKKTQAHLKCSAFFWALASSTKLATVFMGPGIVLTLLGDSRSDFWHRIKFFLKWILIFYFVIGFPQNFDFMRNINYLLKQNAHTSLVSWSFLTEQWLRLFWLDVKDISLVVLAGIILFPLREELFKLQRKDILKVAGAIFLSIVLLVSKQTTTPFQWYTFPFTNALMLLLVLVGAQCLKWVSARVITYQQHIYWPIFIFTIFPLLFVSLPMDFQQKAKQVLTCHAEARVVQKMLDDQANLGKTILSDAFIPYSMEFHDKQVQMTYAMSVPLLKERHPDFIALNRNHDSNYMPKSEGGNEMPITNVKDPEIPRSFYRLFFNKTEAIDPYGQSWKRIYSDACAFDIWEKISP